MSRNSSGTHSLPAGNPVVTGTTISSSVQNATLSDISTEVTDSLCRSGKGAMLAPLELVDGSAAAPGLSFDNDPDCGLYRSGANDVRMAVAGADLVTCVASGITVAGRVVAAADTAAHVGVTGTGNTTGAGVSGVGGATDGNGVVGQGTSAGAGVHGTGGNNNGIGVAGVGGTGDGPGVYGTGTGTGPGGSFLGGATGVGVTAVGQGGSAGLEATGSVGGGYGAILSGGATSAPLRIVGQSATPTNKSLGDFYADSDTNRLMFADGTSFAPVHVNQRSTVTYSASMTPDAKAGTQFTITATNNNIFTINAPTNPTLGQRITITIRNTAGGALGAATWNAVFKMATWTQPGSANSRSIEFVYDGTNWVELFKSAADIPN